VGLKPISVAKGFLQCFDAVGWVIWPVKIVPEMTYKVLSGMLYLCSLTKQLMLYDSGSFVAVVSLVCDSASAYSTSW